MDIRERKIPWWLIIVTGVLIIVAGVFALADKLSALTVIAVIIAIGTFAFAVFNFVIAIKSRDIRNVWVPHLVQGIINIILFILAVTIPNPATLKTAIRIGIIIACWLIVFGVFEVIAARQNDQSKRSKMGILLVLIGLVVLVIPLIFRIDYLILIGIVGIVFGVYRSILGIVIGSKRTGNTTSLR